MIEYFKEIVASQFDASLCTLNECVRACPAEHWAGQIGKYAFWHVAYHTLHFVDLYLSLDEKSFSPPSFFRPNLQFFDHFPPDGEASLGEPYEKDVIIEYVAHCRKKAAETIASESHESLAAPSGFPWYQMSRGEHHLTSIRHAQHHAGQLGAYLRKEADVSVDWVGKV